MLEARLFRLLDLSNRQGSLFANVLVVGNIDRYLWPLSRRKVFVHVLGFEREWHSL